MAARKKLPRFATLPMTFMWPKLIKPDFGTDEYPKPDGEYNVKCIGEKKAVDKWIKKVGLDKLQEEAIESGKEAFAKQKPAAKKANPFKVHPLYVDEYDEDENETGNVIMNFKMKASGVSKKDGSKWNRRPILMDAKGKPMVGVKSIYGGTVGRVSFDVDNFFTGAAGAGLSKYLVGVRILELVSEGMASASDLGFEDEEEGYEFDEGDVDDEFTDTAADEDAAGGDTDADEEDF